MVTVDRRTRFEGEPGTNPEELIGAAHASCFSMALSNELGGRVELLYQRILNRLPTAAERAAALRFEHLPRGVE